jgi:uncharacterized protein
MDPVQTTVGALVAGLVTSVHCVGMCGPLACGIGSKAKTDAGRMGAASTYHAARLGSYTAVGALCGALGQQPLHWFFDSPAVLLPWVLVAVFLLYGFGLEKRLPKPAWLMRFTARARFRTAKLPPLAAGATLGAMTPLLPCGPLYLLFAASLVSGSAVRGAEFALAFGLGTVPLLWLAQHQLGRLRTRLSPITTARVQRGTAVAAALILAWRLHGTLPFQQTPEAADQLPSCCHQ